MKPAPLLVALTLLAGAGGGGWQAPAATAQTAMSSFRSGVEIVSLSVTVTDRRQRYIKGLESSDFEVYEEGVRQDISFFASQEQPIALSLLLDSSASMQLAMPTLQAAAINFVRRLTPRDLAQVIDFDSRVTVRQEFTADQPALEGAIRETVPDGSTALYTALYIALRGLQGIKAGQEADIRRQAVIVFSDGEDTTSLVAFDDVFELARQSETNIYTILLRGFDVGPAGFQQSDLVMRQLASETGGRSFSPERIQDLDGVYAQIAEELSNQYTLGYVSNNTRRDGAWRRVNVQVKHRGAAVRARRGYYGPTEP